MYHYLFSKGTMMMDGGGEKEQKQEEFGFKLWYTSTGFVPTTEYPFSGQTVNCYRRL